MSIVKYTNSVSQDFLLIMPLLFTKDLSNMERSVLWTIALLDSTQATLYQPHIHFPSTPKNAYLQDSLLQTEITWQRQLAE